MSQKKIEALRAELKRCENQVGFHEAQYERIAKHISANDADENLVRQDQEQQRWHNEERVRHHKQMVGLKTKVANLEDELSSDKRDAERTAKQQKLEEAQEQKAAQQAEIKGEPKAACELKPVKKAASKKSESKQNKYQAYLDEHHRKKVQQALHDPSMSPEERRKALDDEWEPE